MSGEGPAAAFAAAETVAEGEVGDVVLLASRGPVNVVAEVSRSGSMMIGSDKGGLSSVGIV